MKKTIVTIIAASIAIVIIILFQYGDRSSVFPTVYDFNILEHELSSLNQNALVIFDIDRVLVLEMDPWERGHRDERKKAKTVAALFEKDSALSEALDRQTRDHLWSIYAQTLAETVIDNHIVKIIKDVQAKGVKVIALTRFLTGKIGIINAIEDLRVARLKSMGIDFRNAFPNNHLIFKQFSYENKFPVFKDGILFTTMACSKGELLKAFFEKINWYPERVIMFDDKIDNHISVQEMLKKLHIPYKGYRYMMAAKLPAYFDKDIAEFQMQYLIDHREWISTDQARKMMGKPLLNPTVL